MEYLDYKKWEYAICNESCIKFTINPFLYNDGRKPRLPRKRSDGYNLISDTQFFFQHIFSKISNEISWKKFKIILNIICGNDGLGKADLDNYCKAILDGITHSRKIWDDDKQIDEILIKRVYDESSISSIGITITNGE